MKKSCAGWNLVNDAVGEISFSIFLFKFISMPRSLMVLILATVSISFFSAGALHAQKIVSIHADAKGQVTIDRIMLQGADLAKEVQQRLWRSYMSNGKMVSSISLHFDEGVTEEVRNEVLFAIKTGQEKTLTVLSLHKYKKRFEDIGASKQDKIKKHFPVLFQRNYEEIKDKR